MNLGLSINGILGIEPDVESLTVTIVANNPGPRTLSYLVIWRMA